MESTSAAQSTAVAPAAAVAAPASSSSSPAAPSNRRTPPCPDWRFALHSLVFLFYLVGGVYFVLLPDRPLVAQGVYIDENALAVGGAQIQLTDDTATSNRVDAREQRGRAATDVRGWIVTELRELQLEVSEFVPELSINSTSSEAPVISALYRAPKGDGRECFVLVTEYPASAVPGVPVVSKRNGGGISGPTIMMELTRHLVKDVGHTYMHKDIIFLFVPSVAPSNSKEDDTSYHTIKAQSVGAFGAWMDAYHGSSSSLLRSGRIALVLTLDQPLGGAYLPSTHSLDVIGFHGLTPNLDVPSVLFKVWEQVGMKLVVAESIVAEWEPVPASSRLYNPVSRFLTKHAPFLSKRFYSDTNHANEAGGTAYDLPRWITELTGVPTNDIFLNGRYLTSLSKWKGLWRFMLASLACGSPSAGAYHSHAGKYAIDAATLRAIPLPPGHGIPSKQHHLTSSVHTARALLSALRSFNNLVEKLHHSTYWYILMNARDFVTMSKYIYVAVFGLAGLPLLGIALLYSQPTSQQRFGQAMGVLAWIYAGAATVYFSAGFLPALLEFLPSTAAAAAVPQSGTSSFPWLSILLLNLATVWLGILRRFTRRQQQAVSSVASSSASSPIDLLRDSSLLHRGLSPKEITALSLVEPRGVELPESPAMLPLLPPRLSRETPPPMFQASLDWRTLWSLTLLLATGTLVPIMVVNYSVCLLTLVFIGPLLLVTNATMSPARWYRLFLSLRQEDGSPVKLRTAMGWEVVKYMWRSFVHIFVLLIVSSPATMLLMYAQFHGLSLALSFHSLLSSLSSPAEGSNLLWYTFFFTYLPMYTVSWIMLGCAFEVVEQRGEARKDKKTE
jgi:hypothetical protein